MPQATTDSQIRALVDQFVDELSGFIRQSALEAVGVALGDVLTTSAPRKAKRAATETGVKKKASKRTKGGRRSRRSAEDLEQLGAAVLDQVRANPGQRLEEMAVAMAEDSIDLKRPIQLLIGAKKLRTEGQKRGTKYFAGGGGGRKKASRKKAGRK